MHLIITLFTPLILSIAFLSYNFISLEGTNWHCDSIKTSFISESFKPYQSITEHMTISFNSDNHFTIREMSAVTTKVGTIENIKLTYTGTYEKSFNNLIMNIEKVIFNKPHSDNIINNDYASYNNMRISYKIRVKDNALFFFNKDKSEIHNFVCLKV